MSAASESRMMFPRSTVKIKGPETSKATTTALADPVLSVRSRWRTHMAIIRTHTTVYRMYGSWASM